MDWIAYIAPQLLLCAIHYLVPATLLATTPKRSWLRYLAIPCLVWTTSQIVQPVPNTTPTRCTVISVFVISFVQALHLLLIQPKDDCDFAQDSPETPSGFLARLSRAIWALWSTRAVNTPWQVKNVPPHPAYFTRRGMHAPPRARFLLRQTALFAWQYLMLNILQVPTVEQAAAKGGLVVFTEFEWDVPVEIWIERVISSVITWFVASRIILDIHYRAVSIFCVAVGLNSPSDWPPVFGRMGDAYTLRGFWGEFWHQILRQPFTSVSRFITRDLLSLPRPSLLERYTNIFVVFLLSGILHLLINIGQCIPLHYSTAMQYFLSFVLGIMLEDGVQALYSNIRPSAAASEKRDTASPLWRKAVGFVWVIVWMGVTSTNYFHPMQEAAGDGFVMVPFNLAEYVGFQTMMWIAGVGGIILGFVFEVEV